MTNTVSFPGLGLEFTLNRVAASPFGFNIYWYAVIIVAGAVLAWFYCSRKGPKLGISDDDLTDLLIFAVPLALVGARLYYILFYLDLFKNEDGSLNFSKMLDVRDGGLAIYGGSSRRSLCCSLSAGTRRSPFWPLPTWAAWGCSSASASAGGATLSTWRPTAD